MTARRISFLAAFLAVCTIAAPGPGAAQSVVSTGESFIHATLVAGRAEADGSRMAGLVLDVAPQWKTYWRNPGAAGIPPSFDWTGSRNLKSAEVLWPRPAYFDSFGLTTIGYSGRVVFPVRIVPEAAGQPVELALDLALGVCREICVLEEAKLALRIDGAAPEEEAAEIAAAEATVPRPGSELGLTEASCRITGTGKKRDFDATLDFGRALQGASVILEGPDLAWFQSVETTSQGDSLRVTAKLSLLDESIWVNRSQVRMTVLADGLAADIQGCTAPAG
jgi:DsbC/DsbD-like thiol-disulfide interchange protein